MSVRVGALGQQGAGFIPNDPGVSEGKLRVGAQRHSLLLAKPLVAEMPGFAPAWRYSQRESIKSARVYSLPVAFALRTLRSDSAMFQFLN